MLQCNVLPITAQGDYDLPIQEAAERKCEDPNLRPIDTGRTTRQIQGAPPIYLKNNKIKYEFIRALTYVKNQSTRK
jgi:hypothetical protein